MRALSRGLFVLAVLATGACDSGEVDSSVIRTRRDFQEFQNDVYPVLIRDCGFDACHGGPGRFLRIWGPGRVRLGDETGVPGAFDNPSGDEISTTYSLALSMIDAREPGRSPLLRKPLAVEAGGSGHLGVDQWGRDVYRTTEDEGYVVLLNWVFGPDPTAEPAMPSPMPTPQPMP